MRNSNLLRFILTLVVTSFLFVHNVEASLKSGDRAFNNFNWSKAIKAYERYDKKNPGNVLVIERLATAYRMTNNWEKAVVWYENLYNTGSISPENIYLYGQALRANMQYDAAKEVFTQYGQLSGSKTANGLLYGEEDLNDLLYKNHFTVAMTDINSAQADFAPIVKDGVLYFTSDRMNNPKAIRAVDNWNSRNFLQIFMVGANGTPSADSVVALPSKGVNAKYHEGPVAFHPSSGEMYFTRTNYMDNKLTKSSDDVAKLKVYKTPFNTLDMKGMSMISEALPFNNDEYSVGHVTFNEDGSIMYFTSDMPGGYGATDIWMAKMGYDGSYGTPVNLGSTINTEGNEMFPNFQERKLYFASNGHRGLGGLDIYFSEMKDGAWKNPENLGYPINTNYDDFSLVFQDEHTGYFTSNRIGGMGDDDIYSFERLGFELSVFVYDYDTKQAVEDADIMFGNSKFKTDETGIINFFGKKQDVENIKATKAEYQTMEMEFPENDEMFYAKIPMTRTDVSKFIVLVLDKTTREPLENSLVTLNEFEAYTNEEGKTYWLIYPELDYVLSAEKTIDTDKKYLSLKKEFDTKGMETPDEWNATILLDYFEIGKEIELDQIYYDLDKYFIRPDAAGELTEVVALMKEYPEMEVEMGSHTDCRASMAYNQKLSDNRAKAAMEYLVRNGIDADRLTYKGYGETKLTNSCACECERSVSSIGVKAFRKCEDEQVANCSEEDHQANRRTTFKVTKF